ncbi:hypothetical protein LWI28_025498 [Acer negundo]|uniref:HMA domain-containing protein n=1 Tax=Acer negundo TaxID=4023 RepID=A0AAD5IW58_ACENE|nr:hypothetical protein LWI28_025498 [Acer negundo]
MIALNITIYNINVLSSYVKPGDSGVVIVAFMATCNLSMDWSYKYSTWVSVPIQISDKGSASVQKAVMKLDLHDERDKKQAMKTVSGMSGVDSIQMDMKDRKLTVVGDIDRVEIVGKLRKLCHTEIVSVKEPEKKKEEPKKEEQKKPEDKKAEDIAQLQKPVFDQQNRNRLRPLLHLITQAISSMIPLRLPKIENTVKIPVIGNVHMVASNITIYNINVRLMSSMEIQVS